MRIDYSPPIAHTPWNGEIPCTVDRTDPVTSTTTHLGFCAMGGQGDGRRLACWRSDEGWTGEDFAETPADRIKGWLELVEGMLRQAADATQVENKCQRIVFWRAACDGFEVVDRITLDENVVWNATMKDLYLAIRTKVREISTAFETNKREASGEFSAYKALSDRTDEMSNLAESTKVAHSLMAKGKAPKTIDLPPGVNIADVEKLTGAILSGAAAIIGAPWVIFTAKILAAVALVWAIVRVVDEIITWVKGWF